MKGIRRSVPFIRPNETFSLIQGITKKKKKEKKLRPEGNGQFEENQC